MHHWQFLIAGKTIIFSSEFMAGIADFILFWFGLLFFGSTCFQLPDILQI